MDFSDVLLARGEGGPFAGMLFMIAWFFSKTWMLWIGIMIGLLLKRNKSEGKGK